MKKTVISLVILIAGNAIANDYTSPLITGIGEEPTVAQIAAWDIDVRPDGLGLPVGLGTAEQGEGIFLEKCAHCHGDFGEGVGRWPVLTGGQGTLSSDDPVKTVGSYWPYTSTLFDYIYRAMPYGESQSLSANEVYALSAYILAENEIIEYDFEVNQNNFAHIKMPNQDNFMADNRSIVEVYLERCMNDCKEIVRISSKAKVLDVTPDTDNQTGL